MVQQPVEVRGKIKQRERESSVVQPKHSLAPTARDVCAFVP